MHVKKAQNYLGSYSEDSKIYAEEAGNDAGWFMKECELHVKKATERFGYHAKNSKIYTNEAGNDAGGHVEDSKLSIYELKGKLNSSCFKENNEIYLGRKSYRKHPLEYRLKRVKIWKEKTLERY